MAETTNQVIEDELTERDVELERYRRGLVTRLFGFLARVEEDIVNRVNSLDPTSVRTAYQEGRTARLIAEVQKRIDRYAEMLDEKLVPELEELARNEAAFGVKVLSEVPPVLLDVVAPATVTLRAAVMSRPFQGRLLREWVREHPAHVRARLRGAIRQGVAQGETVDQIVRRIRGTRANSYRDGVMEINRRGAEAMVRTAVNHVVSSARQETYAANEDLIKGVKWVSTLDSRTSQACMGLDGRVFPLDKGPRPPAHVNCRSSTVPIVKSWKELGIPLGEAPAGTRASMDGQVPEKQTYNTWLRKRSRAFQDEVLGKTRADLYREGGLTLDKFIDSSGRAYTLEELRRRVPDAFRRAGL